jgi:TRAP-type C4-dicarboxylate transport system permease small subunit
MRRIVPFVIFALAGAMFLAVFAQVIFRYVLKHPLPWSEELARYLMIWVACLAASEAYRENKHVGVTLLVDAFPAVARRWMESLVHLAVLAVMAVIVYQGAKLSWLLQDQRSPALEIPMTWPYLAVPVGGFFIGLYACNALVQGIRRTPDIQGGAS